MSQEDEERLINEMVEEKLRRYKEIAERYPIEATSFAPPRVPIDEITRKANERYMEIVGGQALLQVPAELREAIDEERRRCSIETLRDIRDSLAND
jgi:hypothetical protein